jgi:prepilin-type N-terminal cleavage/methylation domain-containing protein/prepilin-type processing-associated H-X9-DG protein
VASTKLLQLFPQTSLAWVRVDLPVDFDRFLIGHYACGQKESFMSVLSHKRRGFTLVELLVVIGIIALLISILLPTLARARDSAKSIKCGSNAKQLATGLIGYAQDFNGTFPIGWSPIGYTTGVFPAAGIVGIPTNPVATQRSRVGWNWAVSGWLNSNRAHGFVQNADGTFGTNDPNDNYHPALYCPQVLQDFDQMWTHYGINPTICPDWWFLNNAVAFFGLPGAAAPLAPSCKPLNMANLYADNFLLWDGQLEYFVQFSSAAGLPYTPYPVDRRFFVYNAPSVAFNGIDFSQIQLWSTPYQDWDLMYRNDEGEDPTLTGDPWRSSEFPAMIVRPLTDTGLSLGQYWYPGQGLDHFRGQEDLIMQPPLFWETDLQLTQIMRHNGKTRCNTALVDGSVRGMGYNPRQSHPALPGGPYAVGDLRRTHLRTKWPNPLPRMQ